MIHFGNFCSSFYNNSFSVIVFFHYRFSSVRVLDWTSCLSDFEHTLKPLIDWLTDAGDITIKLIRSRQDGRQHANNAMKPQHNPLNLAWSLYAGPLISLPHAIRCNRWAYHWVCDARIRRRIYGYLFQPQCITALYRWNTASWQGHMRISKWSGVVCGSETDPSMTSNLSISTVQSIQITKPDCKPMCGKAAVKTITGALRHSALLLC